KQQRPTSGRYPLLRGRGYDLDRGGADRRRRNTRTNAIPLENLAVWRQFRFWWRCRPSARTTTGQLSHQSSSELSQISTLKEFLYCCRIEPAPLSRGVSISLPRS